MPRQRALGRARELLPRRRARGARGRRLPAAHRLAVPLGATAAIASFDDYLGSLRSKRRNQVRRERRELAAQGVAIEALDGDAIPDALFEPMFRIYLATVDKQSWGRQYLNARFFELLARALPRSGSASWSRARGEELVAGAVNVQKGDALYGRYWGALRAVRHLHFNVCYYAGIEHCIARGLARFEPGAGGEYKQLRGFDATPTWSCHFLADRRLADAVGQLPRARARRGGRTRSSGSRAHRPPPRRRGAARGAPAPAHAHLGQPHLEPVPDPEPDGGVAAEHAPLPGVAEELTSIRSSW